MPHEFGRDLSGRHGGSDILDKRPVIQELVAVTHSNIPPPLLARHLSLALHKHTPHPPLFPRDVSTRESIPDPKGYFSFYKPQNAV